MYIYTHTIYKRIPLFGLNFYVVKKIPLNLRFNGKILGDNPIKLYLQFYLKCLQNKTLSYKSISSQQTYPKFKNKKEIMTLDKKKKKKTSSHMQSACDEASGSKIPVDRLTETTLGDNLVKIYFQLHLKYL